MGGAGEPTHPFGSDEGAWVFPAGAESQPLGAGWSVSFRPAPGFTVFWPRLVGKVVPRAKHGMSPSDLGLFVSVEFATKRGRFTLRGYRNCGQQLKDDDEKLSGASRTQRTQKDAY